MKAWKDTTEYSHGERGKIEPQSWTIECGELQITVFTSSTRSGMWLVMSRSCGLPRRTLGIPLHSSAEIAQDAALNLVRRRLTTLQDDYQAMVSMEEGDDEKDE